MPDIGCSTTAQIPSSPEPTVPLINAPFTHGRAGVFVLQSMRPGEVRAEVARQRESDLRGEDFDYRFATYVNSSDSLHALARAPALEGANVTTVAGSGDFPLIFAWRGCAVVSICDSSLGACALTELKIRSLSVLNYREYWTMFGTVYKQGDGSAPIFDRELYGRVRPLLSDQAREYFDTVLLPGFERYSTVRSAQHFEGGSREALAAWNGPVRFRGPLNASHDATIGRYPFLATGEAYQELQTRVTKASISIERKCLSKLPRRQAALSDLFYISNVLGDEPFGASQNRWLSLAPRVGFTVSWPQGDGASMKGTDREAHLREHWQIKGPARLIAFDPRARYGAYLEQTN